jgi:hypothetical protein
MILKSLITALLIAGCSSAPQTSEVTGEALVGNWKCGPTTVAGELVTVKVETLNNNSPDGTFETFTTSVITPKGSSSITTRDRTWGTWRVENGEYISSVDGVTFLSSSDPTLSLEFGQKVHEQELAKKSRYRSKVLSLTKTETVTVPVESLYKEAEVETRCERV